MGQGTALAKLTGPLMQLTKKGLRFFSKNSNLILTVVSATGVLTTVVLAVTGTIKAVKLYEEKQPSGTKEIVKTVWKCYIPTIGMVILVTTAILCNGRMNAKKIAVLTSAYGSSMEALKRMEGKMKEIVGPKKAQEVIDETHSSRAEENLPKSEKDIIKTGNGDELFYLEDYGQWIYTDINHIELAELKTEKALQESNEWSEEGDNFIIANTALEFLGANSCLQGSTHGWCEHDLAMINMKGPKFRISSKRMNIPWMNNENRAVGTIWFEPEPDLI